MARFSSPRLRLVATPSPVKSPHSSRSASDPASTVGKEHGCVSTALFATAGRLTVRAPWRL